ncbi:MAG: IS5/IS1182 family transposase, partial [Xanthomonadales bacterium]|nr:IS5/IS1182 family transposase [Xanthomonadales bacterium]
KGKWVKKDVLVNSKDYINTLEQSVEEDRKAHGKKPLRPKVQKAETKNIKQSTTDPDSGYMVRDGKPKGLFYLDHRTA